MDDPLFSGVKAQLQIYGGNGHNPLHQTMMHAIQSRPIAR